GELKTASHAIIGGNIYVGGQVSRYFYDDGTFTHYSGDLLVNRGLWPGNQTSQGLQYDGNISSTGYACIRSSGNLGAVGTVVCSEWFRSIGATGWTNHTYGGGIYMVDS